MIVSICNCYPYRKNDHLFVNEEVFVTVLRTAVDIEKSLTVQTDGQQVEEWLELANGCEYMRLLVVFLRL